MITCVMRSSTKKNSCSERLAGAVVLVAALVLACACSRDKDPYRDYKAPQMLEEGDRLLRANDLPAAESVFRKGLVKAEKAGYPADKTRVFHDRLLRIAVARENLADPEVARFLASDPADLDPRIATQVTLMLHRTGKADAARMLAEKLAQRLATRVDPHELPLQAIGWIVIDRLRTANVELNKARDASGAFVEAMKRFLEQGLSMPAGLRAWIGPYMDHLFDNDRSLIAKEIADLIERIDQRTPPSDEKCIPLDPAFESLGCLSDWK